jgi:chromosome segregation and condensation protein ScpB
LGTAKTITFLKNSLIIIWREVHFVHVARNLLLVEFTKIRGTQNFGRKQSYTYAICTYFGKIFGLKKQHFLPQKKKLNENIGRIFGIELKFSRKWQV